MTEKDESTLVLKMQRKQEVKAVVVQRGSDLHETTMFRWNMCYWIRDISDNSNYLIKINVFGWSWRRSEDWGSRFL
jgi:hypothetical protein